MKELEDGETDAVVDACASMRTKFTTAASNRRRSEEVTGSLFPPGTFRKTTACATGNRPKRRSSDVQCEQLVALAGIAQAIGAIASCRRGCGSRLRREAIHLAHQQEHRESHDHEVHHGIQKQTVVERRRAGCLCRRDRGVMISDRFRTNWKNRPCPAAGRSAA